jgi:hypothetical protein
VKFKETANATMAIKELSGNYHSSFHALKIKRKNIREAFGWKNP